MIAVLKNIFLMCIFIGLVLNNKEVNSTTKNYIKHNMTIKYNFKTINVSTTPSKLSGKWQVGRVSRKQYEIINMLHRKTKPFIDIETSCDSSIRLSRGVYKENKQYVTLSPSKTKQYSFQVVHPRPNNRPLTPSYIEFDYLDDSDERVKRKDSTPKNVRNELKNVEVKFDFLRPPFFLFKVNDATCKATTVKNNQFSRNIANVDQTGKSNKNNYLQQRITRKIANKIDMNKEMNITENKKKSFSLKDRFTPYISTTLYDRIKFFEIYDNDTDKPRKFTDNSMIILNNNNMLSEEKIYLDQIDHDTYNHVHKNLTRFVKKHANYNLSEYNNNIKNNTPTKKGLKKQGGLANWSDFPFIAAYVYEPMQVRCESASISPHWLVASATCLYRHHRKHSTRSNREERSAFVIYCGSNWRLPGRIAYVKRSFIHPRFQARNTFRRYLYNIGVIQVVNSMANTCSGWRPVPLMSHQFAANRDGSLATAVGWGLDRYSSSDVSSYPLMVYEGVVYSDSCPGNVDYSTVRMQNGDSGKNVYCLSTSDLTENDTVQGGLLLIGGKLIALYLQEERRVWGVQSTQYTGIWRLIPWLLDVAREIEDLEM